MPKHAENRYLPFKPDEMFDLVADIDRYPEFLPWCIGARIRERDAAMVLADLIIGFRMFREKFTSRVALDKAKGRIDVEYVEGPLRYLRNAWRFVPEGQGCRIEFEVDFEFRSKVLEKLIGVLFHEAFKRMVAAFEARARSLFVPVAAGQSLRPDLPSGPAKATS